MEYGFWLRVRQDVANFNVRAAFAVNRLLRSRQSTLTAVVPSDKDSICRAIGRLTKALQSRYLQILAINAGLSAAYAAMQLGGQFISIRLTGKAIMSLCPLLLGRVMLATTAQPRFQRGQAAARMRSEIPCRAAQLYKNRIVQNWPLLRFGLSHSRRLSR